MILNILQTVLVLIIFFVVKYLTYQITDVHGLPDWLNYKPFNCYICLTFWTLLGVYAAIGLIFKAYIILIVGIILAILNAIAMWIDQKNKTVNLDEYELDR